MRSRSWHFRKGVAGHAPYYEEPAEFGRILKSELAAIANQQTDERTAP